jgi:hypothetical protein
VVTAVAEDPVVEHAREVERGRARVKPGLLGSGPIDFGQLS